MWLGLVTRFCWCRRADDAVAGLIWDDAPSGTSADVAADPAPGVAIPVVGAGPTTDMDVGTAGGLLPDVADFDPTSAWGDGDDATAAIDASSATGARKLSGRGAVNKTMLPRTHASANVGRLSPSPRRAAQRLACDPQGRLLT